MPNASASPMSRLILAVHGLSANMHGLRLPCAASDRRWHRVRWSRSTCAAAAAANHTAPGTYGLESARPRHVRGGNASRPATVRLGRLVARSVDRYRRGQTGPAAASAGSGLIDHAGRSDDSAVAAVLAGLNRLDLEMPTAEDYVSAGRGHEPDPPVHRLLAPFLRLRVPADQQGGLPRRRASMPPGRTGRGRGGT